MLVEEQEEINTYSILQLLHSSLINHNQSTSTLYLIFGHLGTALIKRFLFWHIFWQILEFLLPLFYTDLWTCVSEIKLNWIDGNNLYFHSGACFYFESDH